MGCNIKGEYLIYQLQKQFLIDLALGVKFYPNQGDKSCLLQPHDPPVNTVTISSYLLVCPLDCRYATLHTKRRDRGSPTPWEVQNAKWFI